MPALPCAGSTYHYQGQESLPSLSLFPSFFPFSLSLSSLLSSPRGALAALPGADQSAPNAAPPASSISPARTEHPELHGQFGAQSSPFGGSIPFPPSLPLLFCVCGGQRQAQAEGGTGSGGRAESQETKHLFSWKCPGKEAANLGKGEHRAGERSGGVLSSALASRCGRSREKKENRAGSFPAGIGHCLKLWNTDIFFN